MGDLIVMSRQKSLLAREFFAGHNAEILFFTGVRYYRMNDAAEPAMLATVKRGPKRRRSTEQRLASKLRNERRREALA